MSLTALPLNTSDIPRSALDIAAQTRTNPLPWKGQFSPQLVEALLRTYAMPGDKVLDPFVGSGTVLGECARLDLPGIGTEINPAAVLLARLYEWTSRSRAERRLAVDALALEVQRVLEQSHHVSGSGATGDSVRPQAIADHARSLEGQLVSGLLESTMVLADPTWSDVSAMRLRDAQRRVGEFILGLPLSQASQRVFQADARQVPIEDGCCNLVLTSPPYINVFNYHQQYRPAVEALDHDVLDVARSEIGSNRKHRMNRFLTVIQYAIDMTAVLQEMQRVLTSGGRLILVIGRESMVRGVRIPNGDLMTSLAVLTKGFRPLMRQERAFTNRYGQRIIEDILHFERASAASEVAVSDATSVAQRILELAIPSAAGEVEADLRAAVRSVKSVKPSPIFSP